MSLKYRPEIDGLRALAVLAVVFYHAEMSWPWGKFLSGGFLGVDVFFVISGYLITSILTKELEKGKISFTHFYERRARRILPALFTVILVSLPLAWFSLLPKAMEEYAGSVLAALFFFANFYFYGQDSYAAEPSSLKPFLHTWSLSIEEQFYILFPFVLIFLWRWNAKKVERYFWLLAGASLVLAEWGSFQFVDANFFLLPSRAWELLVGSILAVREMQKGRSVHSSHGQWIPLSSLILLLLCFFVFHDQMRHPSFFTVVPVGVTCLLLWYCNGKDWVSKLLSTRPLLGVGLVSYSFYLWHFPIFAFCKINGLEPTLGLKGLSILLSLGLSILSYFFVEQPFRNKVHFPLSRLVKVLAPTFLVLGSIQLYLFASGGAAHRMGPLLGALQAGQSHALYQDGRECHARPLDEFCEFNYSNDGPVVLNIGDSHADVLGRSLDQWAASHQYRYVHMTSSGCPLVLGTYALDNGKVKSDCDPAFQEKWLEKIKTYRKPIIFYSGRFPLYISGERYDNGEGGMEEGEPFAIRTSPSLSSADTLPPKILQTLRILSEVAETLILVYPIPEAGWDVPQRAFNETKKGSLWNRLQHFKDMELSTSYSRYLQRSAKTREIFDSFQSPNLLKLDPAKSLCDPDRDRCFLKDKEYLFYRDDDHLTPAAVKKMLQNWEQNQFDFSNL